MSEYFSGSTRILKGIEKLPDRRSESRRMHQRFSVKINTELECGNVSFKGIIIDISKKGCRAIIGHKGLVTTNKILLKFTPIGELDIRIVKGTIKHMNEIEDICTIGIEFEKIQNF